MFSSSPEPGQEILGFLLLRVTEHLFGCTILADDTLLMNTTRLLTSRAKAIS